MNFTCMSKGCKKTFKNHVDSIITFARSLYVYSHSIISEVYLWLLLVPLSIRGISGEPTVLEGNNLQLICEVVSRIKPTITWTKEEPGNQGNTVVIQGGKVLARTNINRTYSGTFTCIADNGFGKPENQTVYVNVTCEYALKKNID